MGVVTLDAETLGQKHLQYNKFVKEFTSTNTSQELKKNDYNDSDVDNLFKIDIASKVKDVDYILEVFKCEDMLYVSRAIKQSVWLISDIKYANIINPEYLHTRLLPEMTIKAGHKLILTIRLNLKDEKRVELFYKYYEDKMESRALVKWLPYCSTTFIENVIEKRAADISYKLMKRLSKKSITIFEIFARKKSKYDPIKLPTETKCLLNNDAEKYLSIVTSQEPCYIPKFSPKLTYKMMEVRPDIILDNFEIFATKINIPTFVKFLKKEDIKDFLFKHLVNENLKSWFTFETLKHFVYHMPNEMRSDFIKYIFIEKAQFNAENGVLCEKLKLCYRLGSVLRSKVEKIYKWYKFAPFHIAFAGLERQIRLESNPSERIEIFSVLIACAKRNSQKLQRILQYYRDKHINETLKFKIYFVNIVLSKSNSHRFDAETWTILNDIFHSMGVYSKEENNVQNCVRYIIVYKVVHDTKVPDVIAKKFAFDTLKSLQSKLNDEEKDKVFNYLYQLTNTEIQNLTVNTESDLRAAVQHVTNILNLLSDWKKNITDYSFILEKVREIIKVKNNKSWNEDLSGIYKINKSWRKHLFKESLFLHPTQEACVNALKHGPEIIMLCKQNIYLNDSMILTRFLNKLRVYWPETLAKDFEDTFRNQLNDKTKHKTSIRGLCVLLPKKQLNDMLREYIPHDTKINWAEIDDFTISIQKCFAKYMLLARPHPPVHIVLLYAKGDYLQFVLPSVHSIIFNLSSVQSIRYMPTLLDAPVSLQKHGIKTAFAKLNIDELLPMSLDMWKSTKNCLIRATVFKLIFELLCKEQNESKIKKIWHVLDIFIDTTARNENRIVYDTICYAKRVPLPVKQRFCIKSYRYLRSFPPKTDCDRFLEAVISMALDLIEFLDLDFVVEYFFDSFDKQFTENYRTFADVISAYLLSTKSEAIQTQRYEKIFVPVLKKYLSSLKDTKDARSQFRLRVNFNYFFKQLLHDVGRITIEKNMITPIKLFNDIYNDLQKNFSDEEYYVLIITWNLAAKYMQLIEKYRVKITAEPTDDQSESDDSKGNIIHSEAAPEFGKICIDQLKEEIKKFFPTIYRPFSEALYEIFDNFHFNGTNKLATLRAIQEHTDMIEGHLLVVNTLPYYLHDKNEIKERHELCQAQCSHPSAEVRIHYRHMLRKHECILENTD